MLCCCGIQIRSGPFPEDLIKINVTIEAVSTVVWPPFWLWAGFNWHWDPQICLGTLGGRRSTQVLNWIENVKITFKKGAWAMCASQETRDPDTRQGMRLRRLTRSSVQSDGCKPGGDSKPFVRRLVEEVCCEGIHVRHSDVSIVFLVFFFCFLLFLLPVLWHFAIGLGLLSLYLSHTHLFLSLPCYFSLTFYISLHTDNTCACNRRLNVSKDYLRWFLNYSTLSQSAASMLGKWSTLSSWGFRLEYQFPTWRTALQ